MVAKTSDMPRWSLSALTWLYALGLGWSAIVLPWRSLTVFGIATGALALGNAVVGALAALRHRVLGQAWRVLAWATLAYFVWLSWQVVTSALYLREIYESLGKGIALLLVLALVVFGGLTLPVAIWWFARARRIERREKQAAAVIGAGLLLGALGVSVSDWLSTRSFQLPAKLALPQFEKLAAGDGEGSLLSAPAARCPELSSDASVAVVSYLGRKRAETQCVQAPPGEILGRIARVVRERAIGGAIKVDLFGELQPLRLQPGPLGPLADSLAVRPGLDGVCFENRCLMPWQLVAHGLFATGTPLPYADKLQMGIGYDRARQLLGEQAASGAAGLSRVVTLSVVVNGSGKARAVGRGVQLAREPTLDNLKKAERAAMRFIRRAQQKDGSFRYELDLFSAQATLENPSIPRHAGTSLVMCELSGKSRADRRLAERALGALASWERRHAELSALVRYSDWHEADIGSSALGLIALIACRKHVGDRYDALIGRVARLLLELQDERGHFHPAYDLAAGRVIQGPTPLFAGGQAIFALSLLEKLADQTRSKHWPPAAELHREVERGMSYVAEQYWPSPLADFFYLKENWHCLAARASLGHHRHEGYERFCLDYVSFKTRRFVVDQESHVDEDAYGGYNFGNLVPPHNGSTAGVGEAIAAAIAIQRTRGEDSSELEARLRQVLGFLLPRQFLDDNCFACNDPRLSYGGFTGESVGATGRIDHTQHALSAIGHGLRQLGGR